MARLSVNLNKVALLRNSRHTGVPDILEFARIAIAAGAQGITLHPRPDERHVRRADVSAIAKLMAPYRPRIELNIEGYPNQRFIEIVKEVKAEQYTLVPDTASAFTSEEGWKLDSEQMSVLKDVVPKLKKLGGRVIIFVDPDPVIVARVQEVGADGIEIYTGSYAHTFRDGTHENMLKACVQTAEEAHARGLAVHIGHDLNLKNLPAIVSQIPYLAEASVGHELTADALKMGFAAAVHAYACALASTKGSREFELLSDPFEQFREWFDRAQSFGLHDQNMVVLATATSDAIPSARVIFLKEFDKQGFVFYTNYESKKAQDLAKNPHASLLFYWPILGRQVRVYGSVTKTSQEESATYFKSRRRESQLGAWASSQSAVIADREELEKKVDELRKKFEGKEVPLPPHWGGYRLEPTEFEFWQGGENRLHDRIRYEKKGSAWNKVRLAP